MWQSQKNLEDKARPAALSALLGQQRGQAGTASSSIVAARRRPEQTAPRTANQSGRGGRNSPILLGPSDPAKVIGTPTT
ncbi:MAG TPA: hypothetical protein VH643_08800 [Gemmataceae bacterium]|jgi:hypothetical protein